MTVIWKYELTAAIATIEMPNEAKVLTVQVQNGKPFIWAQCDPVRPVVSRKFETIATGERFDDRRLQYIGTFVIEADGFVGHLFEVMF